MNRLLLPVVFVLSIIVVGIALSSTSEVNNSKIDPKDITPFAVDDKLPVSAISDENGKTVVLEQVLNSPSLVVFWSTGCKECPPLLSDLRDQLTNSGIKVVLINVQDQPNVAAAKLTELGITFPSYYDQESQTFRNWSGTIPATYYIVQNRIKYFFPGRMSAEHISTLLTLK